ncbi:MKRN2 opposite strand protein isoform X2 [Agrilus planipennis]|uniref:MKRN2 opposite strand protein isoform X2 n=1 Tax=Agrilus planipennis TaxID=224129 RepID=A0A1W4X0E9_AGRPL|nr:MKRN2 opposite strand protein isoform X2 [Agrilus planipennis]
MVKVDMDPGIVCFQHCGPKVFCFSLPEHCPVCSADLADARFSLLPFRVPYPFVRASQYSCAVVIKPTTGDFLNDYYNSMDLHIGVTTSSGTIVEFDKNGLRRHHNDQWNQCLLLDQATPPWREHWDNTLMQICKQKHWSSRNYSEDRHNCYTFVLNFLKMLNYGNLSNAASNKTSFCEKFIIPRTTSAGKYISLYRKLKDTGCYVHKGGSNK